LAMSNNLFDLTPPTILGRLKTVVEIIAATIAVAALVLAGVFWIEDHIDTGSVVQERSLTVYAPQEWVIGESRICLVNLEMDSNGMPTGKLARLVCSGGREQVDQIYSKIRFSGQLNPIDFLGMQTNMAEMWKCTRDQRDFNCEPD
jgi:hypothetical protein